MRELVKLPNTDLEHVSHDNIGDMLYIYVRSCRDEAQCPYCGWKSGRVHSRYESRFRDLTIDGKRRRLSFTTANCFATIRSVRIAPLRKPLNVKGKRSRRLTYEVVKVSMEVGSVSASGILRRGIADVGKSIICELLKKGEPTTDKSRVGKVCIDDFALKRRFRCGTIMADIELKRVLDIFESREPGDVTAWLKTYPNIEVASRDGSRGYASAISRAHPDAIQVRTDFT